MPAPDVWQFSELLVSQIKEFMRPEVNQMLSLLFGKLWFHMNGVFPRKLWTLTVNYMMSKESVKKRISPGQSDGMSFTEFTYQLFQAYDFYHLMKNYAKTIRVQKNQTTEMDGIHWRID